MSTTSRPKDENQVIKREKVVYDNEEYILRKRLPPRYPSRPNDVYVNSKTNFKAQLARCFKALENENFVLIHGLGENLFKCFKNFNPTIASSITGAAVSIAINLALQVQLKSAFAVEIAVNTSTVDLTGNLLTT